MPQGYVEKVLTHYVFIYPEGAERIVDPLIARAEPLRKELVASLGKDPGGVTRVYLAKNSEDFFRLQPGGQRLPDWVAGVAYGDLNVVVLRQASHMGQPINLRDTFAHEMSHIVIRQALPEAELPKWFIEGLAQWQAGEFELDRSLRLAKAALQNRLIPLSDLIYRFPAGTVNVTLAYDQSFAFVSYLIGEYGQESFHRFIQRLGDGEPFRDALESTYFVKLSKLEDDWRNSLEMNYNWIPLLTSGGTIWTLGAILAIWGYARHRRRKAKRMAEWEAEENAMATAAEGYAEARAQQRIQIFPGPLQSDDDNDDDLPRLH